MSTTYIKQLIAEMKQQSAIYRNNIATIKSSALALKQEVNNLHREFIQTENKFMELSTGVKYDTPVVNINTAKNRWQQTGSY